MRYIDALSIYTQQVVELELFTCRHFRLATTAAMLFAGKKCGRCCTAHKTAGSWQILCFFCLFVFLSMCLGFFHIGALDDSG